MFSGIKRIFGVITIEVANGVVRVEGIPSEVIASDIRKIWKTSRVDNNLFLTIGTSSFSFYEFFCIEIVYALNLLIENRRLRANRGTLKAIVEELEDKTWLKNLKEPVKTRLNRARFDDLTMTPLPAQEGFFDAYEGAKSRLGLNGYLLAGAAGSGKTYLGLTLHHLLEKDLVVIVAPSNSIETVWEDNIKKDFKQEQDYWLSTSKNPPVGNERFLVFRYEDLKKIEGTLKLFKYKDLGIVLDESHNFNELSAQRTQMFVALCATLKCTDVLWSSGTPIKAISVEAIPLIRTIDPLFTPEVEARFKAIYGVSSQRANDMLAHRLAGLMYVIEKKDLDIDPPIFQEVKIRVPNGDHFTLEAVRERMIAFTEERLNYYASQKKVNDRFFYDTLDAYARNLSATERADYQNYVRALGVVINYGGDARFCAAEMVTCNRYEARKIVPWITNKADRERFKDIKSVVKYVRLKVQGECLGRIVGRARIEAHVAMCVCINYEELIRSTEKKVIIFTSYVEVVNALMKHFKDMGLNALFVYAETNKNLTAIRNQFIEDETANPLVATYKSLSTAVPMTAADVMLLIDVPWRDYQLQQTVSRISRLGANTQTYVHTATLDTGEKPNISTRNVDILKWSQQQVAQITGVKSPFELTDDMDQANLALESYGEPEQDSSGNTPAYLAW